MDYKLQLLSFVVSFIFGIVFYLGNRLNSYLIKNEKEIFKYINTFLFIIDFVLLYIVLIYKVNQGIFHIYFIIIAVLGYILALSQFEKSKKYVKWLKSYITSRKKVL